MTTRHEHHCREKRRDLHGLTDVFGMRSSNRRQLTSNQGRYVNQRSAPSAGTDATGDVLLPGLPQRFSNLVEVA